MTVELHLYSINIHAVRHQLGEYHFRRASKSDQLSSPLPPSHLTGLYRVTTKTCFDLKPGHPRRDVQLKGWLITI